MMRADHPWRQKGGKHPASKLDDGMKLAIRNFRALGIKPKALAREFDVSVETIYRTCKS